MGLTKLDAIRRGGRKSAKDLEEQEDWIRSKIAPIDVIQDLLDVTRVDF